MINLSYEEIPYPSLAYAQSRPDRLAAVATLLGLSPPPVSHCRVLELGCASGGNLIPLAHVFPNSHFVGIDGSARQIAEGQMTIADLALDNIQLQQQDIMAITADLGQFDYIIAHGVYSWAPEAVRDKLLAVCRQNLAPDGVAYVSYNTYPGWHLMDGIRHMLRYHTRRTPSPPEKLRLARELLTFMTDSLPAGDTAYSSFLHAYAGSLNLKLVETDSH